MKFNYIYMVAVPHRDKVFSRSFKDNSDILCDARFCEWAEPIKTLWEAKEVLDHDFNSAHWISNTQTAIEHFSRNYNHHQLSKVRFLIMNILQDELNLEIEADLKSYKYSSYIDLEFYVIEDTMDGEHVLNRSKNNDIKNDFYSGTF